MKKIFNCLSGLMLLSASAFAQAPFQGKVNGALLDENKKPLEFGTVMLLKAADSSLVKGAISDTYGKYEIENIKEGKYLVAATMVGYQKVYSPVFELSASNSSHTVPTLELPVYAKKLNEVTVTAQRPFIEQKVDRTVLNVESSIVSSGSTALEVLQKAPGVTVDQDDNISLKGKQGVMVMIDGKQTHMSAADLSNMLKNMQSDAIDQIELITNPSSKYDAAGNAGIINIKLKKNKNYGMNGNVTLGTAYGRYPKANAGASLNYRNGKWNAFSNVNYGYRQNYGSNTILQKQEQVTLDQYSHRKPEANNGSIKAGVDYTINNKNVIGFMANGFINKADLYVSNNTRIRNVNTNNIDSSQVLINDVKNLWWNYSLNGNYKHSFDSTGRELTADVDYANYRGQVNDNIVNNYYIGINEPQRPAAYQRSDVPSDIDIKSAKVDYIHPIGKTAKFEAGLKSSYVVTDNNSMWDKKAGEIWTVDTDRTNHFKYTENINAAYMNYSRDWKKFGIQLGLRGEHTYSDGHSVTNNSSVKTNYVKLFPSVFLKQNLSKDHQINYSYSRRIDRPNYQNLNPFIYVMDSYTYFQGNPYLKPAFTNQIQVSHVFKGAFTTSLSYSRTTDFVNQIPRLDDKSANNEKAIKTKVTPDNLNSLTNYNLGITAPIPIMKGWFAMNNINAFYQEVNHAENGYSLKNSRVSFNFNTNHNITLPNNFSAEIFGMYNSPGVDGVVRSKAMYMMSLGIQKSFLDKKATLKLNVNDVFNTMRFRGNINSFGRDVQILGQWESRQARLTFTYKFGKNEVKPARRRSTGSESEQNRVNMNGNG